MTKRSPNLRRYYFTGSQNKVAKRLRPAVDIRDYPMFDERVNFHFGDYDAFIEDDECDSSGSDDGSVDEGRVGATLPTALPTPTLPSMSTSQGGKISEVYKTDDFYCSGVVTSAFDFSEPWEDSEYSFPGWHSVKVSADHPQRVFEKRVKEGGEWRVVHTLCKDCYLLDRANEEEMAGFFTSGMTEEQYFRFCRPKHLRREKKLLANKRQRLIAESGLVEPAVSNAEPSKEADSFLTPVKVRKESSVAPVAPSISPVKRSKVAALLKVTADAVLAAKEASAKQTSNEEASAQSALPTHGATVAIPATPTASAIRTPTATPKVVTLAEISPQLIGWINTARKSLKVSDLKDLCRANALMVSGTKNELLDRVMKCKLHGGPGVCPWCKQSKLEWSYGSEEVTALPRSIKCKHFAYLSQTYCSYLHDTLSSSYFLQAKTRPQYHTKPLKDTPDGVLASKGISAGSFLA